jgi:hypothetical protein
MIGSSSWYSRRQELKYFRQVPNREKQFSDSISLSKGVSVDEFLMLYWWSDPHPELSRWVYQQTERRICLEYSTVK